MEKEKTTIAWKKETLAQRGFMVSPLFARVKDPSGKISVDQMTGGITDPTQFKWLREVTKGDFSIELEGSLYGVQADLKDGKELNFLYDLLGSYDGMA